MAHQKVTPDFPTAEQPQIVEGNRIRADLVGDETIITGTMTVRSYSPVLALCRGLQAAGHNPTLRLECWRGTVLALTVRSIGEAALSDINGRGTGFRRCRPAVGIAPHMRPKPVMRPLVRPPRPSALVRP